MSTVLVLSIALGLVGVALIARLLWPRQARGANAENNWEQGLHKEFPSMNGESSLPVDNVQSGYNIAFGVGDRD